MVEFLETVLSQNQVISLIVSAIYEFNSWTIGVENKWREGNI